MWCPVCGVPLLLVLHGRQKPIFFEDRAHAPNFSVTDCDMNIERKLSSSTTRCTFTSRREVWEFVFRILMNAR